MTTIFVLYDEAYHWLCRAAVADCADCAADPRFSTPHECDEWCETKGKMLRSSERAHHLAHQPMLHECGAILTDRQGQRFEVRGVCGFKCCVQFFCPGCRRYTSGWGPVGCPCDGKNGHGTAAEHKRPGAGRLQKPSKRHRRHNKKGS